MSMRDDVMEIKKELEEVREESFAMELLRDYKKANKRQFATIIIILCMWFATIGYLIYILNDITVITDEYSQEITDIESINDSTITNGGN